MKTELQQALCRDFPEVTKDWGGDPRNTCMAFGFDVGDGWEPIIRKACERFSALAIVPRLAQVKEKFGTLRMYWDSGHIGGVPWWRWPAAPFLALWFFARWWRGRKLWRYVCGGWEYARATLWRMTPAQRRLSDLCFEAAAWIEECAERESETVCEDCGKPGKLRGGGWVLTLCDACHDANQLRRLRRLGLNPRG